MESNKIKILAIIAIVIFALIAGFAFLILSPDFPVTGDTLSEYSPIAKNLAEGTGFWNNGAPTARVAPGYTFILSLVYRAGGGFEAMYMIQIIFLAGIGIFAYLIATKFMPNPFAYLAALNVILWPYLLLYTKLVLTEVLFIFLLTAAVYAILEFVQKPTGRNAMCSGSLLGIATLVRPVTLLLPIWLIGTALIVFLVLKKERSLSHWKKWTIALGIFALTLSPWTIRNAIQFRAFIPVATGLDQSIDRGYRTLDYTEGSKALNIGQATILDNIHARIKNIYLFWNPGAQGTNTQLLLRQNKLFDLALTGYKIIFILTIVLAFLAFVFKKNESTLVLASVILYFWAVHTILYPFPRYTLPVIPLVIILQWTTIDLLWKKRNRS